MFSSNQILEISGCLNDDKQLESALEFAIKYSDIQDKLLVYQITDDGRYCVGWRFAEYEPERGWKEYSFTPDIQIIKLIIKQYLEKQEIKHNDANGTYEKGFLMKNIDENLSEGIVNPFYGIVSFEPYTCFYHR